MGQWEMAVEQWKIGLDNWTWHMWNKGMAWGMEQGNRKKKCSAFFHKQCAYHVSMIAIERTLRKSFEIIRMVTSVVVRCLLIFLIFSTFVFV